MGRVQDKVAVVTGAAKGLGEAIALRLAEEGASLMTPTRLRPPRQPAATRARTSKHWSAT